MHRFCWLLSLACCTAGAQDAALKARLAPLLTKPSAPFRKAVSDYLAGTQDKIMTGKDAPPGAFPWQVSLGVAQVPDPFNAHFCGGSLIAPRWVLTAAHCVYGVQAEDILVSAGTLRLTPSANRHSVQRVLVYENFGPQNLWHDIALIQLTESLPTNAAIRPVGLVEQTESINGADGKQVTLTGWGISEADGTRVRALQYLEFPVVAQETCNRTFGYGGQVTDAMLCAGFVQGGAGSCKGDSGGGLILDHGQEARLLGVYSWGAGCALPNKVGVYGRVAAHRAWIDRCMRAPNDCPILD